MSLLEPASPRLSETIASQKNLCYLFQQTASRYGDGIAFRTPGVTEISWHDAARRVESIAKGLDSLGVRTGDVVAMLLRNIAEFNLVDLAILHLGAVPLSLYVTDPAEKMSKQMSLAGVTVLFLEDDYIERAEDLIKICEPLRTLVNIGHAGAGHMALDEVEKLGATSDFDFDERWRSVPDDATACILYTSGTTGEPKAVQLPHRAIVASMANYAEVAPLTPQGRVLSYLPAAHIADRFASYYAGIAYGHTVTCIPDHSTLYADMKAVRPTHFFTVPRVLEKIMEMCIEEVRSTPDLEETFEERLRIIESSGRSEVIEPDADCFEAVRERIGLDAAEWLTVGSAPSARGALAFLGAIGLPFADIWGMSEVIVCTMNPPGGIRLGTIGKPFSRVELRIGDDSELLARGSNMFTGYRNDPQRTQEVLENGWIRTGDLAEIDDEGYVKIVGRKKDMFINSAGKNMSPLQIESAIKVESPLIDYVAAVGDGRRFVSVIISLERDRVLEFARKADITGDYRELVAHESVLAEIRAAVDRGNTKLARVEQVRDWRVVEDEWSIGGELVTGSMKLMRNRVITKYVDLIDAIYQ